MSLRYDAKDITIKFEKLKEEVRKLDDVVHLDKEVYYTLRQQISTMYAFLDFMGKLLSRHLCRRHPSDGCESEVNDE